MEGNLFTHPLTPRDKYWIGYFRADGNIHRRGKHKSASFGQTRFHPVNEFAKHVGREGCVGSRARVTNYNFCIVHSTSSAKAGYALDDLGAKTDLWPGLYESVDFWRGMIDGTGVLFTRKIEATALPLFFNS